MRNYVTFCAGRFEEKLAAAIAAAGIFSLSLLIVSGMIQLTLATVVHLLIHGCPSAWHAGIVLWSKACMECTR